MPSPILDWKSPYEVLLGQAPSYNDLRIFGCECFAYNVDRTRDKLNPRERKCVFIGYLLAKKVIKFMI